MEIGDSVKTTGKDSLLTSDFSYQGYEEWKEAAISSLKGKDFIKTLVTGTYEGITLDPIYTERDLEGLKIDSLPGKVNFLRGCTGSGNIGKGWDICQRMGSEIPEEFNKELLSELGSGQNTVFLSPDNASSAGIDPENSSEGKMSVNGLSLSVNRDLKEALNKVDITKYPIVFDTNISGMELLMMLMAYVRDEGIDITKIRGDITLDPLGYLAENGEMDASPGHYYKKMALMIKWVKERGVNMRIAGVSVLPYHNAGASAVQELAIALSTGVEYIDAMKSSGIPPSGSAGNISFKFGIGSDLFMEMAKLRAGRILWNRILEEYGVAEDERDFFIHAETSMFNQSGLDPYVNMLRITTETFSAVTGGADRITTNPFDYTFKNPGPFSRRVARNVQVVLKEESHLHRLIDPAGGSYFIEKLTSDLAEKTWEFFLEIDKEGGVQKTLQNGFLRKRIAAGKEKLEKLIAQRDKVLVGTNNYGNPDEDIDGESEVNNVLLYSQRNGELKNFKEKMKREREDIDLQGMREAFENSDHDILDRGTEMFANGATIGEITSALKNGGDPFSIKGNTPDISRLPEKMERLRKMVNGMKKDPRISSEITIAVGEPFVKIKPRGDFSKSFFETGGFNSRMIRLKGSAVEITKQILEAGNRIIVFCASDEDYPELVPAIVPVLKQKGAAQIVLLAGNPGENRGSYLKSGVDFFIYRGVDLPEIVSGILEMSGVKNG